MALDSLTLALLLGLLGNLDSTMSAWEQQMFFDSVTITMTVEVTESLLVDPGFIPSHRNIASVIPMHAAAAKRIPTVLSPNRVATLATAWGIGGLFGEETGDLSVIETAGPASWRLRVAFVRSFATSREQELRWSLVHGIF